MAENPRQSTGIPLLDRALGGGLLQGTLTVIIGATGVGKTQLGLSWAGAGKPSEGRNGAIVDLSSRGDSQNHLQYAEKSLNWAIQQHPMERMSTESLFDLSLAQPDSLSFMGYSGKRVLRSQLDTDQWHAWQSQLNRQTPILTQFIYRHLVLGTRRFLVDGIEPQDSPEDSLQLEMLEIMYHKMLRVEHDWLARELLRQDFRTNEATVHQHAYDHTQASSMVLVTTRESMLTQLIEKPFAAGDLSAGANTVILMGRIENQGKLERGLFIAKHRGSYCDDSIRRFSINDQGIQLS